MKRKGMPTNRRKDALNDRARRYADARNHRDRELPTKWENAYNGFQDGYRAAMADARKAVAADIDIRQPTPASNLQGAAWDLFPTIRAFLRPLR